MRFLYTLVPAAALLAASCGGSHEAVSANAGNVRMTLASANTSAAVSAEATDTESRIESAMVTFSSILARNLDGELVSIAADFPVTVDLMQILGGGTAELPAGTLPAGDYDQIVVVISKVELTLTSGTKVTIDPPGGGFTAIVPVEPFTVVDGAVTSLTLRIHAGAFSEANGEFDFDPHFDCERH